MPFNNVHLVTRKKSMRWFAGICMASLPLLAPASASALSFSFSFNNPDEPPLTGLITGLADTADSQTGAPVSVSITSGPAQALGAYTFQASGQLGDDGFSTSNGDLILKEIPADEFARRIIIWTGILPSPTVGEPPLGVLRFGRATFGEELAPLRFGTVTGVWAPVLPTRANPLPEGIIAGRVQFQAVEDPSPAEVPGPSLPLLGAAAAFGYSRKLRHRIQQQKQAQQQSQMPREYSIGQGL